MRAKAMPKIVRAWILLVLLAVALSPAGCSNAPLPGEVPGEEGDFHRAERLFRQGRYLQAVEALDAFRSEHPGSDRIDDAIFLLGMAHEKQGENLLARDEFDRLLRDYPQSDHREEAQFERALAWLADARGPALDPEPTEEALSALRAYLRLYPEGAHRAEVERHEATCLDRLAVKAYLNGRTYLKANHGDAAIIYFEKSLSIRGESSRAADAMEGIARACHLRGDEVAERAAWRRLLDYATPERVGREPRLEKLRRHAEQALTREEAASPGSR
jgi:outer membrane assembly lipoprotein YfiO